MDFSRYEPHISNLRSMLKKIGLEGSSNWKYSYMDLLDMNEAKREYTLNDLTSNSVALIVFDYQTKSNDHGHWIHNTQRIFLNSDKTYNAKAIDTSIALVIIEWLKTIH